MKKNIELLAPVGNQESLYAAIQNGANAVYLGGKLFSARQNASNFDRDQLKEVISYAHLRGVRVLVTVNILIDDSEMEDAIDFIKYLYDIDVDGIIVQDIGLANLARKLMPDLDIHGSTQMTINNLYGAELLEQLGFKRVVLARETPLDEIKNISQNTTIELEGFIHGALCMSYSGQCLMSSMIGGRSGNRGNCAQPCRMAYSMVDKDGNLMKDWDKEYMLSPKDLNALDEVEELVNSGIISLKIEGRLKRPEYVATVVKAYRKALDHTSKSLTDDDRRDVTQIFNRGFTKGLTFGDFGKTFVSHDRPDNRGLYLGKVIRVDKYKVYVLLEQDIEQGDGLEFQLKTGEYKGIKAPNDAKKGTTIHLEKPGYIINDTSVYKTSSIKLLNEAKVSYENKDIKYPIDMEIDIKIGEKPKLTLIYKSYVIEVIGDSEVERSQRVAITKDKVEEQLSKLGDTVYSLNNISFNLEEGAFLPVSILNHLRRDAVDKLDLKLKYFNKREAIKKEDFENSKTQYFNFKTQEIVHKKKISIKVSDINQFEQLDLKKVDRVYIGFYNELSKVVNRIKDSGKEAYLWTDKILYNKDLEKLNRVLKPIEQVIDGVSVSNLGTLKFIKDQYDVKIHSDIGLNTFNSHSISFLNNLGVHSTTLSTELNLKQIKNITDNVGGNIEGIVYGYLPVMITRNCPMSIVKGCKNDKNCESCNFSKGYGLKDRMGITFKMDRKEGYSVIYNSVPLMVLDSLDQIFNSGINMARLDFTNETSTVRKLQEVFYDYINNKIDIDSVRDFMYYFKQDYKITNGHYFRGIIVR